jgi:hypothetical protein
MNKMDEGTREHLRNWIENYSPVSEEHRGETEERMVKVWEDDDYFQEATWPRVFDEIKFG